MSNESRQAEQECDIGGGDVIELMITPKEKDLGEFSVRPHPHINLATVTYLFEGEILHRDSLGNP